MNDLDGELSPDLSVELTLMSGETISVRDTLNEPVSEEAVSRYAQRLIRELQTDTIHTFAYWWAGDFYVDAVRMGQVAALSVSLVADEDDAVDEEWEP